MSNYNTTLQSNNASLQAILSAVNNLSSASKRNEDALLDGTFSGVYKNDKVTTVGLYAFSSCSQLTGVEFPNCSYIDYGAFYSAKDLVTASFARCSLISDYAFYYCSKLENAFFPSCVTINGAAFGHCWNLTAASFPACTRIGPEAFYNCNNLTTVSFPICNVIYNNAFEACTNLTTVSFPACDYIGLSAFDCCRKLTTAFFPVCEVVADYAFWCCSSLTTISLPICTDIYSNAFEGCSNLPSLSLPACQVIDEWAFWGCVRLSSLTLGASTVCDLWHSNAFQATPFLGYSSYFSGTPHIYVPSSLITAYQSATNWTYFSSYFSSIESLENNLITFTISGTEYQAEDGMTWGEWVESEYNTNNYFVDGKYVYGTIINGMPYQDVLYEYAGSHVTVNDTIIAEHNYFTSGMMPL